MTEKPTPKRAETLKRWREARFGMFIHWGLYAIPAAGEWIMYHGGIKIKDYERLAAEFKPRKTSPRALVELAAEAGMKYMVLTTKHHDGFCLWDSKLTDYCSAKTAAGRDLVAEYVHACRDNNMGVGLYYSVKDWHHPNYPFPETDPVVRLEPDTRKPDAEKYFKYMAGQIEELLTNYGEIDTLWFDGSDPQFDGKLLSKKIREFQPGVLINNRLLSGDEDFITPEQTIPGGPLIKDGRELVWESCLTMTGNNWGYDKYDTEFRPASELLQMIIRAVSAGGNCLLNIGPRPDGSLPPAVVSRLREIGAWMRKNGGSIYGSEAGPLCPSPNKMTRKGSAVYLHVLETPESGSVKLPPLKGKLISASLPDGKKLKITGGAIEAPAQCPGVIALEYEGVPEASVEPEKKPSPKQAQIDYSVVRGGPVRIDGSIIESKWRGAQIVRVTQDTGFDHSKERYPGSARHGWCAYTFRLMHDGRMLYMAFEVESPTRRGRDMVEHEGGDEVRILIAANSDLKQSGYNPEAFEITVDALGNTWMPGEDQYPGFLFRHAVKHTERGYNVVAAAPLSMMLKNLNDPASHLKQGDLFRLNALVVQPAPPYKKKRASGKNKDEWWSKLEPPKPGPAHRVYWKGRSTDEEPFERVQQWGLCRLM